MSRIISLFIVIMLTACSQQQAGKQKVDLNAEEQAIRSISMKWLESVKNNDAAASAALFADDGISYGENVEPSVGPAAIEEAFIKSREKNPGLIVDWTTDRVEIAASGDLAVEYGSYKVSSQGPEGLQEDDYGKYVTVYRKVNGTWKVAADIGTSTKPKESSE
jgi:uncharacterized protein (TIGR02246 family)